MLTSRSTSRHNLGEAGDYAGWTPGCLVLQAFAKAALRRHAVLRPNHSCIEGLAQRHCSLLANPLRVIAGVDVKATGQTAV